MIKKVLIANRGEIVNRIIRTCNKMGLKSVVVYSEADKDAGYIARAAESYAIGPSAPVKSYLNIEALVDAIKKSGADAVHPGYGFLSESAPFAEAVAAAGAQWIGPAPSILRSIESKSYCRVIADRAGVPVTPGTIGIIRSIDEIYETAEKVGLPILLKLDKGGGGKGIQEISYFESRAVTQAVLDSMQRIGAMAFACPDVYLEKEVIAPRHIEVQFLADNYGTVVCLGERECSIQRRYQKIIEESPSPVVTEEDRAALYAATEKIIKAIGYSGAGTIEYLRNTEGVYYFMEINARLQVEHPVTELVTDLDLVEWQIRAANGEKLAFSQAGVKMEGHAIECRIYAEDPKTFQPSPGTISRLVFPDTKKAEMRLEHAIWEGYKVSPFYDPMLCKLAVWDKDRTSCIQDVIRALGEFVVEGVSTNIPTALAIMRNKNFVTGSFATNFLNAERVNIGLENYVVTISRQFGCPGKTIAKKMAELLGVEYYDRDILEQVAAEMNLPVPRLESDEVEAEYVKLLFPLGTGTDEEKEMIFAAQQKIILQFAEKNSGIFLGRCADYILRNHANLFSIYIYAPREARRDFCIKHLGIPAGDADRIMDDADGARLSYSMNYARVYSQNLENKNISIDSSLFGSIDETAEVLVSMIRRKFS
ncbi:MAG: cytidylate kinase family protein, partial [Spirochaetaceae bacterium]|nr:cytidylate kinase family protein [Spirochaetaceae bacterium]